MEVISLFKEEREDNLRYYFKEIRKIPLLKKKSEVRLAEIMHGSNSVAAKRARQDFIVANLCFVVSIAKKYLNQGLQFSDLIEEGNIGLFKAVDKYKPCKGFRFSTYAAYWIREEIQRAIINQGSIIRKPVYLIGLVQTIKKISGIFYHEHGKTPSQQEIALEIVKHNKKADTELIKKMEEKLNRKPNEEEIKKGIIERNKKTTGKIYVGIKLWQELGREPNEEELIDRTIKRIEELLVTTYTPFSLDQKTYHSNTLTYGNVIPYRGSSPLCNAEQHAFIQKIASIISMTCTKKEEEIIHRRFGFHPYDPHTLKEIGHIFGITREGVRKIELKIFKKLKMNSQLQDYKHQQNT